MATQKKVLTAAEAEKIKLELAEAEEKERKKTEAYNYFVAAYFEEIQKPAEQAEFKQHLESISRYFKEEKTAKEKVLQLYTTAVRLLKVREETKKQLREFFSIEKLPEKEQEEIKADLKAVKIEEKSFAAVALAACGDKMKEVVSFVGHKVKTALSKKESEEEDLEQLAMKHSEKRIKELDIIRAEAILDAKRSIESYKNGDSRQFAEMMGEGLRLSCEAFSHETDREVAMQWSLYTSELLKVFNTNMLLVEQSGITKKQFEIAEKIAFMGKIIKDGIKATERISAGKADISPEQRDEAFASILMMDVIQQSREYVADNWDVEQPEIEKRDHRMVTPTFNNK